MGKKIQNRLPSFHKYHRFFVDFPLTVGETIALPKEIMQHAIWVLRLREGAVITLFNGQGGEYSAHLTDIVKKTAYCSIDSYENKDCESPLPLTLVQAISKAEHFDLTIQKAVELGVHIIVPVMTERSAQFDTEKADKREQRWRRIIISACEQCGRNRLPELRSVISLQDWLAQPQGNSCFVLSPTAKENLHDVFEKYEKMDVVTLLVGAEGGFSDHEMQSIISADYQSIRLGLRILRTETAAITALSICQFLWGDLS